MQADESSYRFRVKIGDRVRMPDGRLGTVIDYDFPTAPNFLRVHVRPDKPTTGWRRFFPVFTRRFVEEEIDELELLSRAERLFDAEGPIEDAVNRAFGMVVNKLRLTALHRNLEEIEHRVPISQLLSLAEGFIAGQYGHEPGAADLPTVKIDQDQMRAALRKIAPLWKAAFTDNDAILIAVSKPSRTR